MIDVFVAMPGASSREVEERVTKPMEKLLWEIPGVEYIYSTSSPGQSLAIVRFKVGEDEEKSIVKLNQKMSANFDLIPPGASQPLIKPRSIDDVPILALTFSSSRYGDLELRRLAAQVHDTVKQVNNVSAVTIIGGQRREISVALDQSRLAALSLTPLQVFQALSAANRRLSSGHYSSDNREFLVETGDFLRCADDVANVVAGVANGKPVFVRDVATVMDAGAGTGGLRAVRHCKSRRRFLPAGGHARHRQAQRRQRHRRRTTTCSNASIGLKGGLIPSDVQMTITRNYGETAAEKSNELLWHMGIAVVSVSLLIALALGFRESLIVFVAIPVTLALTLSVFYLYGFTLNRITLFALIFSIGILVDDAIVVVENISRHRCLPENQCKPLAKWRWRR